MTPQDKNSERTMMVSSVDRAVNLKQMAQAEVLLEIKTCSLRDKLQDEEKNSVLNRLKLKDSWRSTLRQSKATDIKKDMDVQQQTFERQVDTLDSIIKNLGVNVDEADNQLAQLHRAHLKQIQTLQELQKKCMDYLEQGWKNTMDTIQNQYTSHREQITAEIQQQHQDIEDNSFLNQYKYDAMMREIADLYKRGMSFYQNLYLKNIDKLEKIPDAQRKKHQQLLQNHIAKRQELDSLIKDNHDNIESKDKTNAKLQHLQKKLLKLQTLHSLGDDGLSEIEQQLSVTNEGVKTLRAEMELERCRSRKSLIALTVDSDKAAKKLQNVVNTGERILRLAKLSKKLEDKMLITEELEAPPGNELTEEEEELWEYPELKLFTTCQNLALLQRKLLRRHRDAKYRENNQLHLKIQQLRQHQESMTVKRT
ncbi:dynein regulatory complex subunit 2-like [Eucyclogobius newberryi]|uniref:dynein regulatory complex subunit 2-like n=1 Tax=Eucyclogobius newberryi TaxID=166745 RepID=UPI003B58C6BF